MGLKSKFLATIYNIRRIYAESSNKYELLGYVLGFDQLYYASVVDEKTTQLRTRFNSLHVSFYLNDFALFFTNYLIEKLVGREEGKNLFESLLTDLIRGYRIGIDNEAAAASSFDIELCKFLILFHFLLKTIQKKSVESKRLEEFYEFIYDFDWINLNKLI